MLTQQIRIPDCDRKNYKYMLMNNSKTQAKALENKNLYKDVVILPADNGIYNPYSP